MYDHIYSILESGSYNIERYFNKKTIPEKSKRLLYTICEEFKFLYVHRDIYQTVIIKLLLENRILYVFGDTDISTYQNIIHYNKYLKYKMKYLLLKQSFNKNFHFTNKET